MKSQWIGFTYTAVALVGAVLSVYVMQQTEHDRINKIDPCWLKTLRRFWFVILALVLCYTVLDQSWKPSLPVLLLTMAGVGNLAINALALHFRRPSDGATHQNRPFFHASAPRWDVFRQAFSAPQHRRDLPK